MSPEAKELSEYLETRWNVGEEITDESTVLTSTGKGELVNIIDHTGVWRSWMKA